MAKLAFNSDADSQDVVSAINNLCNSDNNSYPLKEKTFNVNTALDRFFTLAFQADGQWTWDDTNFNTDPIQTLNIVSGTQTYDIGTLTSEVINILRVEMIDNNNANYVLQRLDRANYPTTSLLDLVTSAGGIPNQYELVGDTIYLFDKPNFSKTGGLRFFIERNKSAFASTDTTKVLPVPTIFNRYIVNLASLPYLIEMQKSQKNDVASLIAQDEQAILDYFGNREKGLQKKMTMRIGNFR